MQNHILEENTSDIFKFLKSLYHGASTGIITVWCKRSRQTYSFSIGDIDSAARQILALCQSDDVYIGRGLQGNAPPPGSRGNNEGVAFLGGVCLDIDTREGRHGSRDKPTDPETLPLNADEALQIVREAGLPEPTIVIHTGGGCHIHYLYHTAQILETESQRDGEAALSTAFQATVRPYFASRGYTIDSTADLARLCRAPGTLNHKDQPAKPVRLISTGARIDRFIIEKWIADRAAATSGTAIVPRINKSAQSILDLALSQAHDKYKPENRDKNYVGCALAGCSWLKHCLDDGDQLSEREWYAMIGIVARTENGETWVHGLSSAYTGYNREETADKIAHALEDAGPASCSFIKSELGHAGCARCPFRGSIKSPWNLTGERLNLISVQRNAVYSVKAQSYVDIYHDDILDRDQFDDLYRSKIGNSGHKNNTMSKTCPKVMNLDYRPGNDNLILDDNPRSLAANLWQRGGVAPIEGDASPILEFIDRFIPDRKSRDHVLRYLAHALQHPSVKITHAIILTGEPGTGKSTFNGIVSKLVGGSNARKMEGKELASQFDDRLVDIQFLLIEEANHGERLEASEKLKEVITGEFYNVEKKYRSVRPGRTPRAVFLTSNYAAPLVLAAEDRRWAVFETCKKPCSAEEISAHKAFFGSLVTLINRSDDVIAAFAYYLSRLDLSGFDPNHEPPMTAAKAAATEASRIPLANIITDLIFEAVTPLHKDIVTLNEIQEAVNKSVWSTTGSNPQKIANALKSLGLKQVNVDQDGKHLELVISSSQKIRPWAIRDVARWSRAGRDALRAEWLRGQSAVFDYNLESSDGLIQLKAKLSDA